MKLSGNQILEVKQMYKKYYRKEISTKDICDAAFRLIEVLPIIYQSLTQEDLLMAEESRRKIKNEKKVY